jgi:hypothetical protein
MTPNARRALTLCAALVFAIPHTARAGQTASLSRCEFNVGPGFAVMGANEVYDSRYVPQIVTGGTSNGGSAGQRLTVHIDSAASIEAGLACYPTKHVGLQILASWASPSLSGANTPYDFLLRFTERQPPDYVPQDFTSQRTTAWPDTSGSLSQLTLGFNGVARTSERRRVSARVSGGLIWTRVSGDLQPVGYTSGHMGGHSTFFTQDYRLRLAVGPASGLGFNVGGDVSVALTSRLALTASYRYYRTAELSLPAKVAEVLNPNDITLTQTMEEISAILQPAPLHLTPSVSRFGVSLMVRF